MFEAGVKPGEVLASMPTGSTALAEMAPPGSFVRTCAVRPNKAAPPGEIRIYVNMPAGPTAPSNLLGVVKARVSDCRGEIPSAAARGLADPRCHRRRERIDPLPLSESFTFPSVPAGTYKFSVRASNAAGSSSSSNTVTLTFPTNCSGSPSTPVNFIASKTGNVISLNWQPAAGGAATLSYIVNVSGAFTGSLPTPARSISSPAPASTFNFSIEPSTRAARARPRPCSRSPFRSAEQRRIMGHTHAGTSQLSGSVLASGTGAHRVGLGPSRSFFVAEASAAPNVTDYKALVCAHVRRQRQQQHDRAGGRGSLHGLSSASKRAYADRHEAARRFQTRMATHARSTTGWPR